MAYKIIDTHCHLHDEKFTLDLDEVLKRADQANVERFVTIGCDIKTTKAAKKLASKYDEIYFSAGFHPHEAKFLNAENLTELKILAQSKKCLAIGECGLDYYYGHSSKEEQRSALVSQIKLAHELNLPLVIHLRDAFEDFIEIINNYLDKDQKMVIHCFSGTLKEAKEFINRGFYISLSGIITFKKPGELIEVAKIVPLDKLLIETDCPYLAPHPYRGKRNEPSYINYILEAIGRAKDLDTPDLAKQIYQNSLNFFGLENNI